MREVGIIRPCNYTKTVIDCAPIYQSERRGHMSREVNAMVALSLF